MFKHLITLALLCLAAPTLAAAALPPPTAPQSLQQQVEAALAKAPTGTRFGLLVVDEQGREIVAINPDQRFIPASNTKMFTTAAAYALLPGMDQPDAAGGTQVFLAPGQHKRVPDVVLVGRGDARMSSAADCKLDCLVQLADAIAAKTKVVGDVVADDTLFVDQRWSPGMSWNNFGSNDATAASALSLDSNELTVRVVPGRAGLPPTVIASDYVTIANDAVTLEAVDPTNPTGKLTLEHTPNSREFRLYGYLPANAAEWQERIGVDDPADYAAWRLVQMLKERGVKVTGQVLVAHRPAAISPTALDVNAAAGEVRRYAPGSPLASLVPAPLGEDVVIINKVSQNHHAEQLLRRIGSRAGHDTLADGLTAEQALFEKAGVPRAGYDFSDGSGMSTYNRVSPRAAVTLLRWIAAQPWAKAWYASLPIAGQDGTLKRRFIGTPLAGNLIAKTGTLNATNAISGTFRAASGQLLTFSFFANDVPNGESAVPVMDAVLVLVAAQN